MLNLIDVIDKGLRNQKDNWEENKIHISDLAVSLKDNKCPRQLWLRLKGAEKQQLTLGQMLMFDHGNRIHERLVDLIKHNLPNSWEVAGVEQKVELDGITGRYDLKLTGPKEIIVDFKTLRGRAFQYMEGPKEAHVLQVQSYMMATNIDNGLILYVDREGQNQAVQFEVERNDEAVKNAIEFTKSIANSNVPPKILKPKLNIKKNKGPDSVYLNQPWQCDYCEYQDVSCPGALKPEYRNLGIVAKLADSLKMTKGNEALEEIVKNLLESEVA